MLALSRPLFKKSGYLTVAPHTFSVENVIITFKY